MKPMETIQDLIEEAKVRTVWWALCIFSVCYFLSHTSTSMWMNLPIAILIVCGLRILCNEVEFSWKIKGVRSQSYLSQFGKKQLSLNDSRLSNAPSQPKWKQKIGSPIVEAAINDFIDKILKDFVIDLWYSEITPDKEAPELMRSIILDAIGEISVRVKEINLADLLTRDIVDLVGDHFDLFRKNQAVIGIDVMGTLSSEERDDRLKHHLMASKELHPALISPESEYKVLQKIVGGLLAVVLKPREAQCPIVRTIARELVTCLVMQPIISLASPAYINEVIEIILLAIKDGSIMEFSCKEPEGELHDGDSSRNYFSLHNQGTDITLSKISNPSETALDHHKDQDEAMHNRSADWGQMLEAVTQRRTEVLTPENLENMWTKGRNYKKKELKKEKAKVQEAARKASGKKNAMSPQDMGKEMPTNSIGLSAGAKEKSLVRRVPGLSFDAPVIEGNEKGTLHLSFGREQADVSEDKVDLDADGNKSRLKRSNSTSALKVQSDAKRAFVGDSDGPIIAEFYSPDFCRHSEEHRVGTHSDLMLSSEGSLVPKLKCRVMGAYFEKLGSKSFAVYSIAVTDSENRTWFVKRRYSNFERLHRHLKDIPNYTLHLPPKRIFSSSTEDAFVHQRCIQLDKYLQDLLSIANVAEQHEVWDFLSVSSKNYSFGKSSSVMRTLAVNVDDAVDDIVRQFKGVSDGLRRKVVGTASPDEASSLMSSRHMSWNSDETHEDITSSAHANGWHSDNELNSKGFPPRVLKRGEECTDVNSEKASRLEGRSDCIGQDGLPALNVSPSPQHLEDLTGMPPEWTPPNVSVPLLSLVDKIFQLNRRGWLRRQVFWISKQILQLVMEDAIDDWLLRQIYWLRREDIIAQGIRWIQDVRSLLSIRIVA